MSTKIYNGYKVSRVMTVGQVVDLLRPFQHKVKKLASKAAAEYIARNSASVLDRIKLGLPTEPMGGHSPYGKFWGDVREGYSKSKSSLGRSDFDFECEVAVLPSKGKTLFMLFAEQESYGKAFRRIPGMREYAYFNNTDRPKGISSAAWNRRRVDWDEALAEGTPALSGMTTSCVGLWLDIPDAEIVAKHMPSHEERVKQAAENAAFSEREAQVRAGINVGPDDLKAGEKMDMGHALGLLRWISKTPEGNAMRDKHAALLREILPMEITAEDLKRKIEGQK